MVSGLDMFTRAFPAEEGGYVLIGGAAAWLWLEDSGLEARATKDLDIVVSLQAVEHGFADKVWAFVEAGRYTLRQREDGSLLRYRFSKPESSAHPAQVELFARAPFGVPEGQAVVPLEAPGPSDLSAILLDDDYERVVRENQAVVRNAVCLTPEGIVLLKARAYLDLSARRAAGQAVDSRVVKKHASDVFRLANLLRADPPRGLVPGVVADLARFVEEHASSPELLSARRSACANLPLSDPLELLDVLRETFDLGSS